MAVCMTGLWELGLSRRSEEAKGVRGARAPSLLAAAAACVWALAAHQPSPTTSRPDYATLFVPDPVPRRGPRAPWHGASDFQKCQCRQTARGRAALWTQRCEGPAAFLPSRENGVLGTGPGHAW